MEIDWRTYFVNMHVRAPIGASRSSRLFAVNKRTFREGRMDERTYDLPVYAVSTP